MTVEARSEPAPRAQIGPAFDAVNDQFHEAYERARAAATRDGPVFVMLADTLVMFRGATREASSFSPRAFHLIKSIAHAPVALYALLESRAEGALEASTQGALRALLDQLSALREAFQADEDAQALPALTRSDLTTVLDASRALAERTLAQGKDADALDHWTRDLGPPLLRLISAATKLQLDALHLEAEAMLRTLSESERASLQVVVTGDHQARARSLGMQYFRKRLAEPPGLEKRVTYAEGVADEQSALALVGTRRFDRALARSFFGNELRMQRDILGDAAAELLDGFDVTPIA